MPVLGLSPSELRIAWPARATSPDVARFVRHATDAARLERAAAPLAAR